MKKLLAAAIMAGAALTPAFARASCASLWTERNQIYRDAGYCFKTARAIRVFGNAGCSFDNINDVPISARERAALRDIVAQERRMGCGD
jgi:hypothetical protein